MPGTLVRSCRGEKEREEKREREEERERELPEECCSGWENAM